MTTWVDPRTGAHGRYSEQPEDNGRRSPTLTRAQLETEHEFHAGTCSVSYGRTGKAQPTLTVERWRTNGALRTWKRDAGRFELPIKHGLRAYGTIDPASIHLFHAAADCTAEAEASAWWEANR